MTELTPRRRTKRHVARSARILSTGVSATAILGITAGLGAAERARSAEADQALGPVSTQAETASVQMPVSSATGAPSALAPLGTQAAQSSAAVSQFPSSEGTVTLPAPTQTPAAQSSTQAVQTQSNPSVALPAAAPVDTVPSAPVETVVTAAPAPVDTVAPITPAVPPVQMTLPPAPSRGSSGGSH